MGCKIIGCASSNSSNPDQRRPREKRQKGMRGGNQSNRCEKQVYPHDGGQVGEKGDIFFFAAICKCQKEIRVSDLGVNETQRLG